MFGAQLCWLAHKLAHESGKVSHWRTKVIVESDRQILNTGRAQATVKYDKILEYKQMWNHEFMIVRLR